MREERAGRDGPPVFESVQRAVVDSVTAERATGKLVVHARYLEPDQRIDATELLAAMDEIGLPPFTLKVVVGAEEAPAPAAPVPPAAR